MDNILSNVEEEIITPAVDAGDRTNESSNYLSVDSLSTSPRAEVKS